MSGIERIQINSSWSPANDWRLKMSRDLTPTADAVYRQAFSAIAMNLEEGTDIIECTKQEARARYDWTEGIDVILHFVQSGKATLQEKFLDFSPSTLTFEEEKTDGSPGVWYYCTAQYYMVAYARRYKEYEDLDFQDWMLVDFPRLKRADAAALIPWGEMRRNARDGRRASFRWVRFDDVPASCIIGRRDFRAITLPPVDHPLVPRQQSLF